MKKSAQFFFLHSVLVFFLIPASSFSEKYKICDVEYELQETKQSAVEKNIPISTERTFESKEEFEKLKRIKKIISENLSILISNDPKKLESLINS